MRTLLLLLAISLFSTTLTAQKKPLVTEPIRIEGLKGNLSAELDTINAKKHKASLIYEVDGQKITITDSSLSHEYSARELAGIVMKPMAKSLSDSMTKKRLTDDSAKIKNNLEPLLFHAAGTLHAKKTTLLAASPPPEPKVQANFDSFALNDSLNGQLISLCNVKLYRLDTLVKRDTSGAFLVKSNSRQQYKPDSGKIEKRMLAGLPIKNIKAQISDGFIYSYAFEIDEARLPDSLKNIFNPSQAFSLRYNLRQNIMAEALLSNQRGVYLRKLHSRIPTKLKPNTNYLFYPAEIFNYLSPRGASNPIFTARDTIVYFNCSGNNQMADTATIREKSFYSIVNLDVFGDMVGFFDEKNPNGLIQTELKVNFYGFRKPLFQRNPFRSRFTFLNKGELFFRISKLDNKSRFLPVLTADSANTGGARKDTVRYVHGYRILEFQNIYAGIRINLGEFEYRGGSLAFTLETSFVRTPLRDTLFRFEQKIGRVDTIPSPTTFGLNTMVIAPGIDLNIFRSSYMDIHLRGRFFFIHPLSNTIKMSRTEFADFYGKNSYDNIITSNIYNIGALINIYLNNDRTRRLIIRGENYIDRYRRGNNFWQAQIGYSADLNRFINLNNPNRK